MTATKQWMPWVLLAGLGGAVAFAALGKSAPPAEPIAPVPLPKPVVEMPSEPESPHAAPPDGRPAAEEKTLVGVVREHVDLAQYTYVRLATDAGEAWAAVYRAPVKDGLTVTIERANLMSHFHSRELNRDFDQIWFGVLPGYDTAPLASGAAASGADAGIARRVAGVMTIADLGKNGASLDGKSVTVQGRVVKETDGVLDRNWIHVQDGTGDLTVTTDAASKIGDEVVVTGTVRTKQDFGAGYSYPVLLEKATLRPSK